MTSTSTILVGVIAWGDPAGSGLLRLRRDRGEWSAAWQLQGKPVASLAVDPQRPHRVYCGTWGDGLWRSEDAGETWERAAGIPHQAVLSLAFADLPGGGRPTLWAGTEPSAILRSDDGGRTWFECSALRSLPSAPTWSFPPRPETHHVKWIAVAPNDPARVYVSIELGGIVQSRDAGQTWQDRRPGAPLDAHGGRTHPLAPERLYTANGDGHDQPGLGYAESHDGGLTWSYFGDGLRHHYLWDVAVDPADPETVLVSAANAPRGREATIYRRRGVAWREVRDGLPDPRGAAPAVFATTPAEPGVFYAASNHGVFRSADGGCRWEAIRVAWPGPCRSGMARAIALLP